MNPGFSSLQAYPFERLKVLYASLTPADKQAINLSIGEPKHPTPSFIQQALIDSIAGTGKYPTTRGTPALRETIATWLTKRFGLKSDTIDPEQHILPVNGTREALFAIAQCLVDRGNKNANVVMPNPFYQIYEGAALLAGARPVFLNTNDGYDFDSIDSGIWRDCQMIYVCSPGNPSGEVIPQEAYANLLELAQKYDFIIVADECYSELYYAEDKPPLGLLQAAQSLGVGNHERCIVMHSLSKRSNAPGLRSGFVAGDANVLEKFFQYRTYHGSAMSLHVQQASIAAWQDEEHVRANRTLYREKFDAVAPILGAKIDLRVPPAGFYLWPDLGKDDIKFCRAAFTEQNVQLLPGQFLARAVNGENPGANRIRLALVEPLEQCIEGAERLAQII
ncbi:MAG: succinyldiaminopimelate transaminase [Gammaproteobacteria bacterium]